MPSINWLSFAIGAAFVMFVWPLIASMLGRLGGSKSAA